MRALTLTILPLALACSGPAGDSVPQAEGAPVHWTSLGEEAAESRLREGFYAPQDFMWRWTAPEFALTVDPIQGPSPTYAAIEFALAEDQVQQAGEVDVEMMLGGQSLAEQTYRAGGRYWLSAPVPRNLLDGKDRVELRFRVEPPFEPGGPNGRKQGLIALGAGLTSEFRESTDATEARP